MASAIHKQALHNKASDTTKAVDELIAKLDHACKVEIQVIRNSILQADPSISEGVKWNAPSFRTHEYFATINLREKPGAGIILHLGAKARDTESAQTQVKDPEGFLKWLADDRAMIVFKGSIDFISRKPAFESLILQWVRHV